MITYIRQLWAHSVWADEKLWSALHTSDAPPRAIREFAHILGAQEVWLSRLEGRSSDEPVWPALDPTGMSARVAANTHNMNRYIAALQPVDLERVIAYTNSAGQQFTTPVNEILLHMMLHSQYHRGKVNQELADAALPVAPVDFIAFVRGAPAATQR